MVIALFDENMNEHLLHVAKVLRQKEFDSVQKISRDTFLDDSEVLRTLTLLTSLGFPVEFAEGRGYRLMHPVSWLSKDAIDAELGRDRGNFMLELVEWTGSTNSDLLNRSDNSNLDDRTVVRVAEIQTQGRGRRSRKWISGVADSLTFSCLKSLNLKPSQLSGLSLAVGVGVVRALIALGGTDFCLKWPNDIIKNGKKIGGILIEIAGTRENTVSVVIGIGLNVRQTANFYKDHFPAATDLFCNGIRADRNQILAYLLIELTKIMETFVDGGFLSFRREWENLHQYHGSKVDFILSNGEKKEGMVRGVDSRGALLIESFGKVSKYNAGEIKLRVTE